MPLGSNFHLCRLWVLGLGLIGFGLSKVLTATPLTIPHFASVLDILDGKPWVSFPGNKSRNEHYGLLKTLSIFERLGIVLTAGDSVLMYCNVW